MEKALELRDVYGDIGTWIRVLSVRVKRLKFKSPCFSNKQPNLTPKAIRERRTKNPQS